MKIFTRGQEKESRLHDWKVSRLEELQERNIQAIKRRNETEVLILKNAIKKLSSRDQTMIKLLFGLENTEKKSQEEVASYFKVTQSVISRRKSRNLRRLRSEMERYM